MTLTEISYYSRRFAPFAILLFLFLLMIYYSIKLLIVALQPPVTTNIELNTIFNKIPAPRIAYATASAGLNFTLDTIEGKPVTATESARVYRIATPAAKFGFRERIYQIAQEVGINTQEVQPRIEGSEAIMEEDLQKLTIDISTYNFTYEYDIKKDPEVLKDAVRPTTAEAEEFAIEFLKSTGRYPGELAQKKPTVRFWHYDPESNIVQPEGDIDANMVEVELRRSNLDSTDEAESGYLALPPLFFTGQNMVMLAMNNEGVRILKAQVKYFETAQEVVGIYPLKSGDLAYQELKAGRGYVVSNKAGSNVVIKQMFLGYYDPDSFPADLKDYYLQPIYVFLGENDFAAYVPAVSNDFLIE